MTDVQKAVLSVLALYGKPVRCGEIGHSSGTGLVLRALETRGLLRETNLRLPVESGLKTYRAFEITAKGREIARQEEAARAPRF